MWNLAQSMSLICNQLIENPNNLKTKSRKDYLKKLEEAKENPAAKQDIIINEMGFDFYVNVKNDICIKLFKELSVAQTFTDMDESVYKVLEENQEIFKDGSWFNVPMKKWDIHINFSNSPISKKISENEFMQKYWAIIKWENCFIQRISPGWRDVDHYSLVEATQEDLKEILAWLTELL